MKINAGNKHPPSVLEPHLLPGSIRGILAVLSFIEVVVCVYDILWGLQLGIVLRLGLCFGLGIEKAIRA